MRAFFFMFDLDITNNGFEKYYYCDEVGRGPLAGPVVACSVALFDSSLNSTLIDQLRSLGVCDSKKLTEKKRKQILSKLKIDLFKLIAGKKYEISFIGQRLEFAVIEVSPKQIDKINILQASLTAMKEAYLTSGGVDQSQELIFIDGNKTFITNHAKTEPIVKGDSKSAFIGLASIIAKEYRDQLMKNLDIKYPGYGFAKHSGYPTKAHKEAIAQLGVSPVHRRSFGGVKEHVRERR